MKLGRSAAEKLREIRALVLQCRDLGVIVGAPLPEYPSVLLERETIVAEIRGRLLSADDVRVVGIYGMGGSGKTRVLKRINNELLEEAGTACPFDALVWVTVSHDPDVRRIQDAIGTQLGLHLSPGWGDSGDGDRARILFRALKRWRFLLMLDDLWEPLDFEAVGIPHLTSKRDYKIALTTRSLQVCFDMYADVKVRMDPALDWDASWKLFCASVGTNVKYLNSPPIYHQAWRIVKMCRRLPLALVVAGRAMAATKRPDEWEQTAAQFEDPADGFRRMDQVLSSLKLSYARLPDETLRQCLLYCCLFERRNCIPLEELVDCWVGEGLLDDPMFAGDNMDAARNRGHYVVERLKSASLLEVISEEDDGEMFVEMHEMIRKMAIQIGSVGEQRSLLLKPCSTSGVVPRLLRSSGVVRMAVSHGNRDGEYLKCQFPRCPNLLSLIINKGTNICYIPNNFFSSMPLLRVLDLSCTNISVLPEEIGLLTELRCFNLSETCIETLPACIGRLVKLTKLLLTRTWTLRTIPWRAIICLTSLEKLDMNNSRYFWPEKSGGEMVSLKDLGLLPRLNDLRLNVISLHVLGFILGSASLPRTIRCLTLEDIQDLSQLPLGFNAMDNLQRLNIRQCYGLQEMTFNSGELCSLEALSFAHISLTKIVIPEKSLRSLKQLQIYRSKTLEDLTLVHQLPHLQCVDLRFCSRLEVLIPSAVDHDTQIFPQLKKMILHSLRKFKCIYHRSLLLPQIEHLEVFKCPKLLKLPLDSCSACCIKQIVAEQEWWDTLQWDEDRTKLKFCPFLKDIWQEESERVTEEQKSLFRITEDY